MDGFIYGALKATIQYTCKMTSKRKGKMFTISDFVWV